MLRKIRTILTAGALSGALLIAAAAPALAGEPTDFVKENAKEVTRLLRQDASKERAERFSKKMNEVVDFRELASRALGEHWAKRTPEEQQEFLDLLQELLEANYKEKLEGKTLGKDYEIEYLEEKTRKNMAIVKTRVQWKEGAKPAHYKMLEKDGEWVIYDIIIDDISLVETYRDSYTEIIEQEGWGELIARMKQKAEQLRAQKG